MKGTTCYVIYNSPYGYCMQPKRFKSISSAKKFTLNLNAAYRILDSNGKCILCGC